MAASPPTAQSLEANSLNVTVPARSPPAGALIVAESFGTQLLGGRHRRGDRVTVTSSLVSVHAALWVTPLVFGELPL